MKKTWIKLKRGILDPKHRESLGIRVWLYLHMLDRTNWETGTILEWRDKAEAADLEMSDRTLTQQRQKLQEDGYITCTLKGDHQEIVIHNWTNPREYTGEIYNEGGTRNNVPSSMGTQSHVPPDVGGTNEGTREGTNKGLSKPRTPTYKLTDHNSQQTQDLAVVFQTFEQEIGLLTAGLRDKILDDVKEYSAQWVIDSFKRAREQGKCSFAYAHGILRNWKAKGKDNEKPSEKLEGYSYAGS